MKLPISTQVKRCHIVCNQRFLPRKSIVLNLVKRRKNDIVTFSNRNQWLCLQMRQMICPYLTCFLPTGRFFVYRPFRFTCLLTNDLLDLQSCSWALSKPAKCFLDIGCCKLQVNFVLLKAFPAFFLKTVTVCTDAHFIQCLLFSLICLDGKLHLKKWAQVQKYTKANSRALLVSIVRRSLLRCRFECAIADLTTDNRILCRRLSKLKALCLIPMLCYQVLKFLKQHFYRFPSLGLLSQELS